MRYLLTLWMIVALPQEAGAQQLEGERPVGVSGAVSITNNGISTIPTFTLGDPAAVFDLRIGTPRFAFTPRFRFALEGKPWAFLFPFEYNVVDRSQSFVTLAIRPVLSFKTSPLARDGALEDVIEARRFLAGVVTAGWHAASSVTLGIDYFYSRGYQPSTQKHTHFLAFFGRLRGIELPERFAASISPQLYYLRLDGTDGIFVVSTFALSRAGWPFSLSSTMNKSLRTDVANSDEFIWNVSLVYAYEL